MKYVLDNPFENRAKCRSHQAPRCGHQPLPWAGLTPDGLFDSALSSGLTVPRTIMHKAVYFVEYLKKLQRNIVKFFNGISYASFLNINETKRKKHSNTMWDFDRKASESAAIHKA